MLSARIFKSIFDLRICIPNIHMNMKDTPSTHVLRNSYTANNATFQFLVCSLLHFHFELFILVTLKVECVLILRRIELQMNE